MIEALPKHELLLKLLKMTASDNDGEALTAIRKATALLASAGWDWERLLAGKIIVVGDPFGNLQRPAPRAPDPQAAYPRAPAAAPPPPWASQRSQQSPKRNARPTINYSDLFGSP